MIMKKVPCNLSQTEPATNVKTTIDLVGSMTTRGVSPNGASAPTTDQLFENCLFYPTTNPYSGKNTIRVSRRPGVPASGTVDADYVKLTGFYHWKALGTTSRFGYYSPAGNVARMTVVDSTGTNAVQSGGASYIFHVSERLNASGVTSLIWINAGNANTYTTMYLWADGDAAQTSITVPSGSVGHPVHANGWTFVGNTSGKIYNSPLDDPTGTYTDFIGVDLEPGPIVTLWKIDNYIVSFKPTSMEWFEIVPNTSGSPLRSVKELARKIGIFKQVSTGGFWGSFSANPPPIVSIDDDTYWIGQTKSGLGVWELNKDKRIPEKISTPTQDKYLVNYGIPSTGALRGLNAIKVGAKRLLLVCVTNNWLCYDIELKLWSIWSSTKVDFSNWENTLTGEGLHFAYNTGVTATHYSWEPDETVPYLDVDATITRNIIVGPMDLGTGNYKRWNGIHILGDRQTTTSNLSISTSFDDFANYSTARTVDMSTADPFTKGLGVGRRIIFKLVDTAQREQRLEAIEVDADVLDT